MIFENAYQTFVDACQGITRRRERLAKPAISSLLLDKVGPEASNSALLSHIIAESLLRRIDRNLVERKNIYLEKFALSQIDLFYTMCKGYPQVPQGHRIANTYLHHALKTNKQGALFEIGVGKGLQVASLLERLSEQPGRLKKMTVVALDPDPQNIADSRARIEAMVPKLGFDVTFHGINTLLEHCKPEHFRAIAETAGNNLVVNSAYTLHHTMHPLDSSELRTQLLRRINQYLKPKLVTLIEPNANHDTEHLARRLHACWEHFGNVFELVDHADIEPAHKFVIKEQFFGREIRDIFGTSDAFRCERHESYESWLLRFAKAGFKPYPGKVKLGIDLPDYCTSQVSDGLVRLGYKDLPLIAIFAFQSQPLPEGFEQ